MLVGFLTKLLFKMKSLRAARYTGIHMIKRQNLFHFKFLSILVCILFGLIGCSSGMPSLSSLNPFEKEEEKLPGKRISVMKTQDVGLSSIPKSSSVASLPGAVVNANWSQPGGSATNAPGHLSLNGALKTVWQSSAGEGSSTRGHLTSSPLVYQNKIFTLDTEGKVRAFSSTNGKKVWQISTTPENEDEAEGYGGGLAIDNGRLFVTTGYGFVFALNPQNGNILWKKKIGIPIRSSPAASKDRVLLVTTEGKLFCLSGIDGATLWTFRGLPESASLLANTSPAISGGIGIVPFASGEVSAFNLEDGKPFWSDSLVRRSQGSAFSAFNTVATPSVDANTVFAVSHSGRMIAANKRTGERLWQHNIASNQRPYVAGNTVFIVTVNGNMVAVSKSEGKVRWSTNLPKSGNWSGPVLAGNRVWAVSSKGLVVGLNAVNGQKSSQRDLDTRIYIPPIIAQNKMYIYTDKAKLIALN